MAVAPAAAHDGMYETIAPEPGKSGINELEYGCSVRDDANIYGPLSVGVPGFMAGVGTIWERWGQLKWPDIVAPARGHARYASLAPPLDVRVAPAVAASATKVTEPAQDLERLLFRFQKGRRVGPHPAQRVRPFRTWWAL